MGSPVAEDLARGESEFLRGNALCDARQFEDAIEAYDHAVALGFSDHVLWNNRGVALDGLGRSVDAVASYRKALAQKADYEVAWYNLGNAQAHLDRLEDAVQAYDRALALRPDYAEVVSDKAAALIRLGRTKP